MAANANKMSLSTPSDREIVLSRVFDAPRELVFEAHSSCDHMKNWWGPRRYEITSCEIDFSEGGSWSITQHGEKADYVIFGEFREIIRPERIVWTFQMKGLPGSSVQTLSFEEQDGKTTLKATAVYDSVGTRDGTMQSGMEAGAAETWDRLDAYVQLLRKTT